MKHDEIVEAISRLDEANKHFQSQLSQPKTKFETFKEYAGVASLLVSLIAALYGAFSVLVLDPRKERAEDQAKLAKDLAEDQAKLGVVMTALWGVDTQANQAGERGDVATIPILTAQHRKLLEQAEVLLSVAGVGSPQDQFYIAHEYEIVNQWESALDHFRASLESAGKDAVLASTAQMRIAQLELRGFGGASPELARRHFDEAEKRLGDPRVLSISMPLYELLAVRAVVECKYGDIALGSAARDRAEARLARMVTENSSIDPKWLAKQRSDFSRGLLDTRCPASGASLTFAKEVLPPVELTNRLELSKRIMRFLAASDYRSIENEMNLALRSKLPGSVLRAQWEQISSQMGPSLDSIKISEEANSSSTHYKVYASYDKGSVKLILMFDAANRLSMLLITPIFSD